MRPDDIVPFAMKLIRMKVDPLHLFQGDFAPDGILAAIQAASDSQSFGGRGLGNEMDNGFVVMQRLPPPIRRDKRKQTVFDLIPLAGPGGK